MGSNSMAKPSRTFVVFESFKRIRGTLSFDEKFNDHVEEEREAGIRFTLENVAKEGLPPLYIDHARENKIPFSEAEINLLLQREFLRELHT